MPVLFLCHAAPTLALDAHAGAEFAAWGASLPKPQLGLVISAHWEHCPLSLGHSGNHQELLYDFFGFPEELYKLQYPAPGGAEWIPRLEAALGPLGRVEGRHLDHGVWVPLLHLWPLADVPLLQLSLPKSFSNKALVQLGQHLSPLRDEGVMILASGALTHNLSRLDWSNRQGPEAWATEFETWALQALQANNLEALCQPEQCPAYNLAHPTADHYRPLLVALGASQGEPMRSPIQGWEMGSFSRRNLQWS